VYAVDINAYSAGDKAGYVTFKLNRKDNANTFIALHALVLRPQQQAPFTLSAGFEVTNPTYAVQPPLYVRSGTQFQYPLTIVGAMARFVNPVLTPSTAPISGYELWRDGAKKSEGADLNALSAQFVMPGNALFEAFAIGTQGAGAKTSQFPFAYAMGNNEASLDIPDAPAYGTPACVERTFSIEHTYLSDLDIYLQDPSGHVVNVVHQAGGSGDNFTNTRLSNHGPSLNLPVINSDVAPFSQIYTASSDMNVMQNSVMTGAWKFRICDNAPSDTGVLRYARLFVLPF
jgi:hypothetical protein